MAFATKISKKLTRSTTFSSDLLHQISPKLDTRCGNYKQNFIYCTYFHKTQSTTLHGNSLFQISSKSVKKYDRCMPLTKVWLALSQYPKNSYLLTTFCNDLHHQIVRKSETNGSASGTRSWWTDAVSSKHSFSLLHKECLKTTKVCSAVDCF